MHMIRVIRCAKPAAFCSGNGNLCSPLPARTGGAGIARIPWQRFSLNGGVVRNAAFVTLLRTEQCAA